MNFGGLQLHKGRTHCLTYPETATGSLVHLWQCSLLCRVQGVH
jgi:hypothetical protein